MAHCAPHGPPAGQRYDGVMSKNAHLVVPGRVGRSDLEGVTASPRLLLRLPEAAKALAISERTLWGMTKRGEIRCVRIGRSVRYSPLDLQGWIAAQKRSEPPNATGPQT